MKRDANEGAGVESGCSEKKKIDRDYLPREQTDKSQKPVKRPYTPAPDGHKFNG